MMRWLLCDETLKDTVLRRRMNQSNRRNRGKHFEQMENARGHFATVRAQAMQWSVETRSIIGR